MSGSQSEPDTPPWKPYRDATVRDEQHIEFTPDDRLYQSICATAT